MVLDQILIKLTYKEQKRGEEGEKDCYGVDCDSHRLFYSSCYPILKIKNLNTKKKYNQKLMCLFCPKPYF